jgi:hypothetical protein
MSEALYVGAMNDGLFIIDKPPRPSNDDAPSDHHDVSVIAKMTGNDISAQSLAQLFAAAPDLHEALKSLLRFNEELCADIGVSKHYPSAERARRALAKAEGRAP